MAAATATINLGWTANPLAETINAAGVFTSANGLVVDQGLVGVARGATGAVAHAPVAAGSFPALSSDGTSSRNLQLRYRMLDGSYKDTTSRYN